VNAPSAVRRGCAGEGEDNGGAPRASAPPSSRSVVGHAVRVVLDDVPEGLVLLGAEDDRDLVDGRVRLVLGDLADLLHLGDLRPATLDAAARARRPADRELHGRRDLDRRLYEPALGGALAPGVHEAEVDLVVLQGGEGDGPLVLRAGALVEDAAPCVVLAGLLLAALDEARLAVQAARGLPAEARGGRGVLGACGARGEVDVNVGTVPNGGVLRVACHAAASFGVRRRAG